MKRKRGLLTLALVLAGAAGASYLFSVVAEGPAGQRLAREGAAALIIERLLPGA